jgi:hypothetical protein
VDHGTVVAEPDFDCGDIDGAQTDLVAFVVADGERSEEFEFVDASFDDVALLVGRDVEIAGASEVFDGFGRDDCVDPAAAQRVRMALPELRPVARAYALATAAAAAGTVSSPAPPRLLSVAGMTYTSQDRGAFACRA